MIIGIKRDLLNEMDDAIHKNFSHFFKNDDEFTAYYNAKFMTQDTECVISSFMTTGFENTKKFTQLLAVLNAIYIQQDCILELYRIFIGNKIIFEQFENYKAWDKVRELRNRIAAHPINSGHGKYRSFTHKNLLNGFNVQFEQYEIETGERTHPIEDLKALINDYDAVGAVIFDEILEKIRPYLTPKPEKEFENTMKPEGQAIINDALKTLESLQNMTKIL